MLVTTLIKSGMKRRKERKKGGGIYKKIAIAWN